MQGPCEHSGTEGEGGGVRGCQGGRAVRERAREKGGSEKTKEGKSLIRGAGKNRKVEAK